MRGVRRAQPPDHEEPPNASEPNLHFDDRPRGCRAGPGTRSGRGTLIDGGSAAGDGERRGAGAPLETDTPGYTLINAAVDWHPRADRPELTLGIEAHNIFDVVARRSTSLLKDYAPLAGRDIRLSARLAF